MPPKKHFPGRGKVKIKGSNSIVLCLSENTCWYENQGVKDQVNLRVKEGVGVLGICMREIYLQLDPLRARWFLRGAPR